MKERATVTILEDEEQGSQRVKQVMHLFSFCFANAAEVAHEGNVYDIRTRNER